MVYHKYNTLKFVVIQPKVPILSNLSEWKDIEHTVN